MTTLTNPHTIAALRELGCLHTDDRLDGSAIAARLARILEDGHIATSLESVAPVQATVGQLATALIGEEDPELVEMIRPLLSSGPTSKVQNAMSNGYLLCAGRVQIDVSIDGEISHRSIGTRFLSNDPDVIQKYVLDPHIRKVENLGKRTNEIQQTVARRQPDMTDQLTMFSDKVHVTWQRAIEAGS